MQDFSDSPPSLAADYLLDTLPWGVLVLGPGGTVVRLNRQAAAWWGQVPAAVLGQPLAQVGAGQLCAAAYAALGQAAAGQALNAGFWLPQAGRWVALSSAPQPTGEVVVYWHDATAQQQGEQQYQALAENTPAVLTRWDADLRLCYASPSFALKIGRPLSALLGCTFGEMGLPADLSGPYLAALRRVFDTGQPQEHYHPLPGPGGEGLCHSRLVPELRHGRVATVLGLAREHTEEALRHAAAADAFRLQLADALGPLAEPVAIQEAVTRLARRHFGAARCCYCEIEGGQAIIRCDAAGPGLPSVVGTYRLADFALLQAGLEAGRPFAVRDVRPADAPGAVDDSLRRLCGALAVVACLAVPVLKNGQLVGALCLAHGNPRAWAAAETALAAEVAERTWAAVAQGHAQAALRRSEARQAFLLELSDALRPLADAVEIQAAAARLLGQYLGVDRAYYVDISEADQEFVVARDWHRPGAPSHARRYPLGDWPMPWLLGGQTWVCHEVDTDPTLPDEQRPDYRANDIGAAVVVPLLRHGRLAATLVANQSVPRAWTPLEVALVEETLGRTWAAVERARAEQALARSEEKYHALFESIDEGFATIEVIFDEAGQAVDYRFLEMNQAHEKMSGVPHAMVGRRMRELVPNIEENLLRRLGKLVRTGEPMRYEQHVQALGRWFDVYASRVGGSGSRTLASVFTDITGRKHREQNLAFLADLNVDFAPLLSTGQIMARVAEQLAGYLGLSRFHLATVDLAADRAEIIFDWQREAGHLPSVLGRHDLADSLTAAGRQHFEAGRPLVTSSQEPSSLIAVPPEVMARRGFGSFVDIPHLIDGQWCFSLTAARAAPGQWRPDEVELLQQLAARLYARLDRAQTETALQVAHTQLVSVLENTHDAFYRLDAQLRFTYINQRAAQLWGREAGALLGQVYWQAFPQAVGSEAYRQHQAVLHTRQPAHFEAVSPVLGIWIEGSIYPGQDGGLSVFFRDITARKRAEEEQAFWLRLGEALRPLASPTAIQEAAMTILGEHLQADRCGYAEMLADDETAAVHRNYLGPAVPSFAGTYRVEAFGAGILAALRHGETLAVADLSAELAPADPAAAAYAGHEIRAFIGAPLVKQQRLIAILFVHQRTPRRWAPAQVALVQEVAERTWAAVERATAETARRASETTLAAVFEALPVGVGLVDAHGRLTLANHRMQYYLPTGLMPSLDDTQYVRWRASDAAGRLLPRTEFPAARALRGEKVMPGIEMCYAPETGPEVWAQVSAVPLANHAGHLAVIIDIDAQKRTEQALRRSEEQFRLFVTTSSDLLYRISPDWRQMLTLKGKNFLADTDDPSATWVEQYILAEDQATTWAAIHAAIAGRRTFELEHRVHRADGTLAWVHSRAVPVLDAQGEITEWFGAATDITARRVAEQQLAEFSAQLERQVAERTRELQASRDLLRSVLDTSLISMSVLRAVRDEAGAVQDFRIELVNQELERETGRRDLVGQLYAQEYPGVRVAGIFELMLRALATGEPQGMEYYYHHEGFDQWFACQFIKLGDGVVATNLDITERKKAEQDRTRNLRLLEQAEALAGLGSWDYDLATGTMHWSDGMYQLGGRPLGSPVAPGFYQEAAVAADHRRAGQLVQRLATGAGDFEETLRLRGPAGEVKTVRLKGVVLHDEQGRAGRVLGVALDLSEVQRLEAENLRLRLEQQHALFEAVQQAQEEERRRMSESLHNGIGQLLYATRLQLDLLPPMPGQPAYREAVLLLGEAIRQTRTLSHELTPALLEEFGLEKTLANICGTLSTPALRWHCHLVFEDAPPLPASLQLAVYRLTQELVQNVLKHAQASEATLEVEVLPAWVVLRVEDNGRGFDPTCTSDGLGLRSLRSRVALLGGHAQFTTAPGQGAQCQVRLPLRPAR